MTHKKLIALKVQVLGIAFLLAIVFVIGFFCLYCYSVLSHATATPRCSCCYTVPTAPDTWK
ncbi:MAG: hypothetical protein QXN16_04180 [Candidatus Micrarchaeaceae archaeon]